MREKNFGKLKVGYVSLQACARGVAGRVLAERRRLEVDIERQCGAAIALREEQACEQSLARAEQHKHDAPLVREVASLLDRLRDEAQASDLPCDVRREGGQSLVIGGSSLVMLEGKAC